MIRRLEEPLELDNEDLADDEIDVIKERAESVGSKEEEPKEARLASGEVSGSESDDDFNVRRAM